MATPDVIAPSIDEKEQRRMEAHFQTGSGKQQEAKYVVGEKGQTQLISRDNMKQEATLFIKNCEDCEYTVTGRCTKILIDSCKNTKVYLKGRILTNVVEVWKCEDFHLAVQTDVKTLQIDLCKKFNIHYDNKDLLHSIVWCGVYDLQISFADNEPGLLTGFEHMQSELSHLQLNSDIDQFIIRYLQGKLTTEQVVRLSNGYPTTDREANEFDTQKEKNEAAAEEYIKNRLAQAGITLGKKQVKKVGRNENCPCGSGKKNKKCCNK
jgi:hypothetical protein